MSGEHVDVSSAPVRFAGSPRVSGEHVLAQLATLSITGSPPRERGAQAAENHHDTPHGITPA